MITNLLFFVTFLALSFALNNLALLPKNRRMQAVRVRRKSDRG